MKYLQAKDVVAIHEQVILPNELQGIASDKSIEAILARIENRMAFGMINDVYELAACYACYLAVGHAFNDANKRTAFTSMDVCLSLNGIELEYDTVEAGGMIIRAAQSLADEDDVARWLRGLTS